jgi:hypothetical protein
VGWGWATGSPGEPQLEAAHLLQPAPTATQTRCNLCLLRTDGRKAFGMRGSNRLLAEGQLFLARFSRLPRSTALLAGRNTIYMCHPMATSVPNTKLAAKAAGISLITLQRWIATGKVRAPKLRIRNGRAVRVWTRHYLEQLRRTKNATYCRGRGRKRADKRRSSINHLRAGANPRMCEKGL